MFSKVQHVGYLVENLDEAVAWYETTFGGKSIPGGTVPTGKIAYVRMGDVEVELIEPPDKAELAGKGDHVFHHVGYVVDDLDKSVADFKAKSYRFDPPEPHLNPIGNRLIHFDPLSMKGRRIHLTQASTPKP